MKTHADLTDVYTELTVFHTTQFADGLRDSQLEKSALNLKLSLASMMSSFSVNKQTAFL